jgi:tripartite-type tricarboxylate transporter receptor subunit TctC
MQPVINGRWRGNVDPAAPDAQPTLSPEGNHPRKIGPDLAAGRCMLQTTAKRRRSAKQGLANTSRIPALKRYFNDIAIYGGESHVMQPHRRHFITRASAFAVLVSAPARAQSSWPARPVHLLVPYPPGGGTDYFARLVGGAMEKQLGQPVIVENRPGAATIIGAEAVARAAPDGYTVLLGDNATYAANRSLYQKLPYDPQKDFAPITLTGRFAIVLLVNTNKLNVASVAELIDRAKRAPGAIDYATPGVGTAFHLATELFAAAAGIKLNHVPYRGISPALQDLAGGQMSMMFADFASARSQLATPGIKALAVASPTEFAGLPGVPTVAASGFPSFEAWAWQGFVVPAGTGADIIAKLRAAYVAAVSQPEVAAKLNAAGIDVLQSTPAEFGDYMRSEIAKWGKVIRDANIHVE